MFPARISVREVEIIDAVNGFLEIGFALQAGLVAALFFKKMWRKFPFFTLYSTLGLMGDAAYYLVHKHQTMYFYTYWVLEGIAVILGLAVVYEIFRHLLDAQPTLQKVARWVFSGAAISLTVLGAVVVVLQWPSGPRSLSTGVFIVEEAARVAEIGILLFLFLFSTVFGLHWRRYEFGISVGLGIFVSVGLTIAAMRAHLGFIAPDTLNMIRIVSFDSSLLIWLGYILVPESVAVQAEVPERAQLEQWNRAMMELIKQ